MEIFYSNISIKYGLPHSYYYRFWETILLNNHVYKSNAMQVHYDIKKKYPLQKKHFDAWLQLFNTTIDELFEGEKPCWQKKSFNNCTANAIKNE